MPDELKPDQPNGSTEPQDKPVKTHTKSGRELTELEKRFARPAGRPATEIDWEQAELWAMYGGTLAGIASALGIGQTTLINAIQRRYNKTFGEWATQFRDKCDVALLGELVERAIAGDTSLLRFLGERRLGLTQKVEVTHKSAAEQISERYRSMTPEQRREELQKLRGQIIQIATPELKQLETTTNSGIEEADTQYVDMD